MAIYRLHLTVLSRSQGRSAVAAAAYRAGARLTDERTGLVHNYGRRAGVLRTALLNWSGTRAELWNAAERAERRKDSAVAREAQVALPHELSGAARWQLALDLATWVRDRYGVAVDLALHAPGRHGDFRNHHAHLLWPTRSVLADQFGTKTAALDDRRTGRHEVEALRAAWAGLVNAALVAARRPERVDHRSYRRQGLPRESEHMTRGARELEHRGTATDRGDERRARRRRNRLREIPAASHPADLLATPVTPAPTPRRLP